MLPTKNTAMARALVGAQISRIKRCIGSALLTQKTEAGISACALNIMIHLGMPRSVKV